MPQRIQLSRKKGWRKPTNCVVVSRPSKWGNPYSVAEYGRELSVSMFREMAEKKIAAGEVDLSPLRGKDLACWCGLDELCHADVLLELANRPEETGV